MRLLGPVGVVRAGREVGLGGPKQRAVLALLLLEAGQVVPTDRLVEEVWRGGPSPGAAKTLRSYVSRLRALLDPDVRLVARGGGYVLSVDRGLVDTSRFEWLAAAGKTALESGDPVAAAARFREALALWRGPALAGVGDVERLVLEAARLEESRLAVVEARLEADIEAGQHGEMTGELERLVREYPLRERLWRLLVLALYRGQRQADALAAYRRARAVLDEELGLEPGEELRALEQAVLRQEVPAAPPPVRHNLPSPVTSFVGREQELARLGGLLGEARLVTLTGTGGAGKTRLAIEAGVRAVGRFADGVWLADLAAIADPGRVPLVVMEALGVRQRADLPVLEALRYRLRSADLLLVLDNCEHLLEACARLATALLRGSPGLRVLATSREPLDLPGEVVFPVVPLPVPSAEEATEQALGEAAAVRLFVDRGAAARGGLAAEVAPLAVAGRICRTLDGLPLALELAAARMGTLSVADIEAQLSDRFAFLAYRRPAADPRHQALRTAIDWSYDLLTGKECQVLAELSVFAGSFGLAQAAEVCGGGQVQTLEVIDRLASKSLVAADVAGDRTRYRLLETIRQYAADRLAEASGTEAARRRHALAYLDLADRERGLAALAREHDNFRAALEWSLSAGDELGARLAQALGHFWLSRGVLEEGRDWLERALDLSLADQALRADLQRLLGDILLEAGDLQRAETVLADAADSAAAAGVPALQARIRVLLADVRNRQGESFTATLEECEAAAAVLESAGDTAGLAEALTSVGKLRFWLEDPAAGEVLERAIATARQSGNHRTLMRASHWLAVTFTWLPIPVDAGVARTEQLLKDAEGDQWAEADLLKPLMLLYAYLGRAADAHAALARCRAIFTGFGARFALAEMGIPAGATELTLGDPVAAERYLREAYAALRAMGERRYLIDISVQLAEALYAQGRLDEAQQMIDEARAGDAGRC